MKNFECSGSTKSHSSIYADVCYLVKKIIHPSGDVPAAEGDSVTLNCTFETSDSYPYLFWYKQHENSSPGYILKGDKRSGQNSPKFTTDKFDAELKDKSVPLKIQKLELSDSAVYYCALQPTVTGNSSTVDENLWSKDNTILLYIH
uniref:Ig-like domain-containing protein n=1 Tax=Salarias fasciatus TaxID=181472 RepID=A0A672HF87_SALFA